MHIRPSIQEAIPLRIIVTDELHYSAEKTASNEHAFWQLLHLMRQDSQTILSVHLNRCLQKHLRILRNYGC